MSLADLCGIGSSGDLGASDAGIFASDGEDGDLEGNSFANGRVICGDLGNESATFERLGPEADWPKDCFGKKSDEGDEGTRLGSNPPGFRKQLRDWRKASCNGSGFSTIAERDFAACIVLLTRSRKESNGGALPPGLEGGGLISPAFEPREFGREEGLFVGVDGSLWRAGVLAGTSASSRDAPPTVKEKTPFPEDGVAGAR